MHITSSHLTSSIFLTVASSVNCVHKHVRHVATRACEVFVLWLDAKSGKLP
jgi:hypothetical protein